MTPDFFIDSFAIQYSEGGHNYYCTLEESIMLDLCDYVMECVWVGNIYGKHISLLVRLFFYTQQVSFLGIILSSLHADLMSLQRSASLTIPCCQPPPHVMSASLFYGLMSLRWTHAYLILFGSVLHTPTPLLHSSA